MPSKFIAVKPLRFLLKADDQTRHIRSRGRRFLALCEDDGPWVQQETHATAMGLPPHVCPSCRNAAEAAGMIR